MVISIDFEHKVAYFPMHEYVPKSNKNNVPYLFQRLPLFCINN